MLGGRIPACVIALAPRKSSALCSAGRVLAKSDESSGVLDQMPAIQCFDPAEAPLRWASWDPRMSALPQHPEGRAIEDVNQAWWRSGRRAYSKYLTYSPLSRIGPIQVYDLPARVSRNHLS